MATRDVSPILDNLPDGSSYKFGIVVSSWNEKVTHALLDGARRILIKAGVTENNIDVQFVPGAFELPFGARQLMKADKKDAIICLGCIIQGETKHDEYIAQAVSNGIMQLGLMSGIPIIFGVLTTHDLTQALERAGGSKGNKGEEAAATALQMAHMKSGDKGTRKKIGY